MKKDQAKEKLDMFSYHEALDRTFILSITMDNFLTEHPVITNHLHLCKKAEKISELLRELYQDIGEIIYS